MIGARRMAVAGLILAVLVGAGLWVMDRTQNVYTSDARVAANMIAIGSDVSGRIDQLPATVGQRVAKGGLLARIDDREACLEVAALVLEIRGVETQIARERARSAMSRGASFNRIAARQSGFASSTADAAAARAILATAEAQASRVQRLRASGLIAQAAADRSADDVERARQSLAQASAAISQRHAEIGEAKAEAGEAEVIDRTIDVLEVGVETLRQRLALRQIDLEHHAIRSPVSGVVDEVFADAGEHAAIGQRIVLLHDPDDLWIDANVKETDIARVAANAPVAITFDAYPGKSFAGHVEFVRDASLSEFALIPSTNASGVFTKITQRIPVRVRLDGDRPALRPGAMAGLRIRAHDNGR